MFLFLGVQTIICPIMVNSFELEEEYQKNLKENKNIVIKF
jgi:hypothetical protein